LWSNLLALICLVVAGWKYKDIILPWLSQKLYHIDVSGLVVLRTGAFAFFLRFKNTCASFYGKQRLRLTYVDEIPGMKQNLAKIQEDVENIKEDVAGIKAILSLPWYKRLNTP